jgi:hypothetical protein
MVAGIVQRLGVFMGTDHKSADEWNAKGNHEDREFVRIHHRVVGLWHHFFYEPPTIPDAMPADWHELIAQRNATHGLWGVKCSYLPFVANHLEKAVADLRVIATRRPLRESIASYRSVIIDPVWQSEAPTTFAIMRKQLEKVIATRPRLVVNYHDCIDHPETAVKAIADYIGVPVMAEAVQFVDANLRRFGG